MVLTACAPKRIDEEPILLQGQRIEGPESTIEAVRVEQRQASAEADARRDAIMSDALAACAPSICEGVTQGTLMFGMNVQQVLAATRTTEGAWQFRGAGESLVMVPASLQLAPRDIVGELAMVQIRRGIVTAFSYQEAQGVWLVSEPRDATVEGRASARAEMLLREGDDLVARGDFEQALNRYDRAQVLQPADALIEYRIATVLDKALRPIEALVRYQLFLHRLELEKIEVTGDAYAKLADAIARARERVIVLEKQSR
jgi:hypothetical protein